MKNLLFLSALFLLVVGSSFLNRADNKQIVPVKHGLQDVKDKQIVVAPPIKPTESAVEKAKRIASIIVPILTNISILAKSAFKIAVNFKDIKQSAERLKPDVECLTNLKSDSCNGISCATLSKCAGTTLSDLLRVMYPFLEAIIGSVESNGSVKPGTLFAIVDSAEKIPGVIPTTLYTQLKIPTYKPKVDAVVTKLAAFRAKLPLFTKKFADAMALLNGIVLSLNPEMFVDTIPVKALPVIKELENGDGLSKDIVKDIDTVLALPAPLVPVIEG